MEGNNVREIKFRAWMEDEMLSHDDLVDMDQETHAMYTILTEPQEDITFMQYTGLKDKNGREIYEGDILKFEHLHNYANELQVVTMDKFMWGTDEYGFQEMIERNYKFEIVGDIYENPELLEVK